MLFEQIQLFIFGIASVYLKIFLYFIFKSLCHFFVDLILVYCDNETAHWREAKGGNDIQETFVLI